VSSKVIKLEHITKIEGHASLSVKVDKGEVKQARMEVFEGARYFEGIVRGAGYADVPTLTSRICGICSSIHTKAALRAVENALDIKPTEQTEQLREMMTLGERLRSHATHNYLFVLPDYYGYGSAVEMVRKHKKKMKRAIGLIGAGNDVVATVAGRDIHPVSAVVGGFSRLPEEEDMQRLHKQLEEVKPDAMEAVDLFESLDYPDFERETQYFAVDPSGDVACAGRYCLPAWSYAKHFEEYIKPYSSAKFVVSGEKGYRVGVISRINSEIQTLSKDARKCIKKSRFKVPNHNPFVNNYFMAVEMVDAIDKCIHYAETVDLSHGEVLCVEKSRAGKGVSAVEAPRGLLFHEYELDDDGRVTRANIITPTSQNLRNIEDDIKAFLPTILDESEAQIKLDLEKLIRSYDPCISCSAHFLKLKWI
jgi:sulfhydrogenase subunit alpha